MASRLCTRRPSQQELVSAVSEREPNCNKTICAVLINLRVYYVSEYLKAYVHII